MKFKFLNRNIIKEGYFLIITSLLKGLLFPKTLPFLLEKISKHNNNNNKLVEKEKDEIELKKYLLIEN